jgi:hypothetical protein
VALGGEVARLQARQGRSYVGDVLQSAEDGALDLEALGQGRRTRRGVRGR